MRPLSLDAIAIRQHGLVTREDAARCGVSRSAWYRALNSRLLVPIHPNVARMVGAPTTWEQGILAAVLAAQPGAMASHRSAVRLHGVPRPDDDPYELTVLDRKRGLQLAGVVVHHPRDLLDLRPICKRRVPTTNILRWLCDLGAVDPAGVPAALGHVLSLRAVSLAALSAAVARHSRCGRPGVPALRAALAEWTVQGKVPDSVLEPAMRDLLQRYRIGPWQFHAFIAGFEVDFWITDTPVVLECDGWEYHARTREQFERDSERDATLIAAGFIPVHCTYRGIKKHPARVAKRITDALTVWGSPPPSR